MVNLIRDESNLVVIPYCNQEAEVLYGELTEAPLFFTVEVTVLGRRLAIHDRLPVDYHGDLYFIRTPPNFHRKLASVEV